MFGYLYWLLFLILSFILYLAYHLYIKIYWTASKFHKMDPSLQNFIRPIFGLMRIQQQNFEKYGDSLHYAKQIVKNDPNVKAYISNHGHLPTLVLCDAQLVKEFLLSPKKFRKLNLYKHSDLTYNKGLFFAEEKAWTQQRSTLKHSFNHESLKRLIPIIQKGITRFSKGLLDQIQQSQQKSIEYKVISNNLPLVGEILVGIIFSEEAIGKRVNGVSFTEALAISTTSTYRRSRAASNVFFSLFFGEKVRNINFTSKDKQLERTILDLRMIIDEVLQNRLKNSEKHDKDIIQNYIDHMRENERLIKEAQESKTPHNIIPITKEEIIHQLMSFYFAGIDTTTHLLGFVFYCLAEYPQYREQLMKEIKNVFGDSIERITYQNLGKMEFTGYFIDEIFRMWSVATGLLARVANEDVQIGPYSIPKGMMAGISITSLMHNPKYYDKPQVFNPYRWSQPGAYTKQPYSFIPFSLGPRSCIGKYVALMEIKLIIIHFLTHFNFQRTKVPFRTDLKLLYGPAQQNLIRLSRIVGPKSE